MLVKWWWWATASGVKCILLVWYQSQPSWILSWRLNGKQSCSSLFPALWWRIELLRPDSLQIYLVISTPEHFKTCWTQWFVYALPSLNSVVWTSFWLTNPSFGSDNPGSRTKRNRLRMKLLRNFAHPMHFIFSQNLRHWQFLQSCYATLGNRHGVNLLPFKFAKHLPRETLVCMSAGYS